MYSFTQKMTCGNSPSMLFCMWEGNLGSENIDQLMKDIEVFPKQAEKKSKNNSKMHYPSFCVFIYFYIFLGEKWHRPQVWGSVLPFSPFGLEELYSHGSAYAVVCFSLKSRILARIYQHLKTTNLPSFPKLFYHFRQNICHPVLLFFSSLPTSLKGHLTPASFSPSLPTPCLAFTVRALPYPFA